LVSNAVNIPVIGADDLEVLGPYVPLASRLGRIAMELADGAAEEIVITAYGALADYDARLLTVAALNGAFQGRADRPVNYVNAPLIAAERGIEVREERSRSARDYTNLVRVELRSGGSRVRVAGTTIGSDHRPWLVNVLGFEIELELAPLFVLCLYDDVPGVIGRVGTLFGEAGINIAGMTVSRSRPRREGAHGADGRLGAVAGARRAAPRRGVRRRPRARARARGRLTLGRRRAPARVEAYDGPPHGRLHFLDDLEAAPLPYDLLDLGLVVAGSEEERRRLLPHALVLRERGGHALVQFESAHSQTNSSCRHRSSPALSAIRSLTSRNKRLVQGAPLVLVHDRLPFDSVGSGV
jgi:hypothetical protein